MAKFDIELTAELERLFGVPREHRDDAWVRRFYAAVPDASLATGPEQVIGGPDGFPYFQLRMPEPGTAFDAFCVSYVLDPCLENGFGAVVIGRREDAEWVFRYGDLFSFKEFGSFDVPASDEPAGDPNGPMLVASPGEAFLPAYARRVLRRVLAAAGVPEPGVLLVTRPGVTPSRSLVFSVFQDHFPNEPAYTSFVERLGWYLPRHYGLASVTRGTITQEFTPL